MIEGRNSKTGDGVLFKDLMSSSSVEPRYYRDTTSSATFTTRTTLLFPRAPQDGCEVGVERLELKTVVAAMPQTLDQCID